MLWLTFIPTLLSHSYCVSHLPSSARINILEDLNCAIPGEASILLNVVPWIQICLGGNQNRSTANQKQMVIFAHALPVLYAL